MRMCFSLAALHARQSKNPRLCCLKFLSSKVSNFLPPKTPAHVVQVYARKSLASKPSARQASLLHTGLSIDILPSGFSRAENMSLESCPGQPIHAFIAFVTSESACLVPSFRAILTHRIVPLGTMLTNHILAPVVLQKHLLAGRASTRVPGQARIPTSQVSDTLLAGCVKTLQVHELKLHAFLEASDSLFGELSCSENISVCMARISFQAESMAPFRLAYIAYQLRPFRETIPHPLLRPRLPSKTLLTFATREP